jgi:hypothetical protein
VGDNESSTGGKIGMPRDGGTRLTLPVPFASESKYVGVVLDSDMAIELPDKLRLKLLCLSGDEKVS